MTEEATITANAAREALEKGDVTIVDIRRKPDDRQIPGSVRYDGEALANAEHPPFAENERVVVYCGSGNSCQLVAAQLREKGIQALALAGGYAAWKEAELPTEPLSEQRSL